MHWMPHINGCAPTGQNSTLITFGPNMYSLTWIESGKLESISTPEYATMLAVWFALLAKGCKARVWFNSRPLIATV